MSLVVAIDGAAGTGKGTITKILSKKFKFINIDTGATYRCVALELLNNNVDLNNISKIEEILDSIKIEFKLKNGKQLVYLNDNDVTEEIRSKKVTSFVSEVSSIKEVRIAMTNLQRKMADGKNVIMEGRDIGTYVLPNADIKFYLDASLDERAKRRFKQNKSKNIEMTLEEVKESISKRDENDKNKEMGALKQADDAIYIDNTDLTVKQTVKYIEKLIKEKIKEKKYIKKSYLQRKDTWYKRFQRASIKGFLKFLYTIVFKVEIKGMENIPKEDTCIICANHLNMLDAAGIVLYNKRKIRFVAKQEVYKVALFRWLARIFDVIPTARSGKDVECMKRCLQTFKDGEILGIFPEGTRKGLEKKVKVKNGTAHMALKSGVTVIPCGISGDFKPFKKVVFNYGKPLKYENEKTKNPDKQRVEEVTKEIMDNIISLIED